ncbi:hypothetical protein O0I10_001614 [Lichtheimia ornata]|uniref:Uncharacterized protein n=1 Tax=Lichtheimia ornata TaxID=688661 RepID=A0AAD7VBV5_9FUNG|nr:uncharacterized protein O0I10_001614 [Lichtheimia ornata]KAJ8662650.1 hypothetical protein O0I10_001614 [Lichtheimia ornata]
MSKHILETDEVKKIIIDAVMGGNHDKYWTRPTEWPNGMKSDILYATDDSKAMPPVLVEVQHVVDDKFMHRVVRNCEEIISRYDVAPTVLIIAVSECRLQVLKRITAYKSKPFFFKLPSYPWANQCLILSKESISSHVNEPTLDPIVALGSFFVDQKQSLADQVHRRDPTIQQLYELAKHICRNQITAESSSSSHLLRVIMDVESHFRKAIDVLNEDVADGSAKRTIDCLEEGMTVLRDCKRQHMSNRRSPSSSSQSSTDGIPESPSQPSSTNESSSRRQSTSSTILSTNGNLNWQFVERFFDQLGNKKMNWKLCYEEGRRKGHFKNYSNHESLKNAYNRKKSKKK